MLKYKKKFSYMISFDIVDKDEILIKQVQGVIGSRLNPGVDFGLFMIKLVDFISKNLGFKVISIVGLETDYMRPYTGEHYYEYSKQIEVEKKYSVWAKSLGYELVSDYNLWSKRL